MSEEITMFHNPRCSTSRAALETLEGSGRSYEVVQYLKTPPTAEQLRELVAMFDDHTRLVRRDVAFKRLGLTDADVETKEQVVAVLAEHPALLQRPILVRHDADGDRAIIGRPKEAVPEFLA
ncbi:MAG: arsenate reductase [Propionibacterium sp.]|nr:arsenate reductase [Propionibacterium sp.]